MAAVWSSLGLSQTKSLSKPGPPLPPAWYVGTGTGRMHALSGPEAGGRVMWTVNVLADLDDDGEDPVGGEVAWTRIFEGHQDGRVVGEVVVRDSKLGKERTVVVVVEGRSGRVVSRGKGEASTPPEQQVRPSTPRRLARADGDAS